MTCVPGTQIVWPRHKCGLHLTHNQHKDYYEPIAEYVQNEEQNGPFKDEEAKARCIATDEIWELQWYPRTPVGFNKIAAPTLAEVLAWALEIDAAEKDCHQSVTKASQTDAQAVSTIEPDPHCILPLTHKGPCETQQEHAWRIGVKQRAESLAADCACGHMKSEHIYEEGACRPGSICPCPKYASKADKP